MPDAAYTITAQAHTRYRITTPDGRPARLAIIDDAGNVVAAGDDVTRDCWLVAIEAQENLWKGMGHLKVTTKPGGIVIKERQRAA